MPRVSVVLATYNGAAYLDEQLASIARQTLPPTELVVSDDHSTDSTMELLEAFAARAPFPVRLHQTGKRLGNAAGGVGENFLRAASQASGEYVAFCDQDDVWLPDKLQRCMVVLGGAEPPALVIHSNRLVDARLRPIRSTRWPRRYTRCVVSAERGFYIRQKLPGLAMVMHRSLLTTVDCARRPPSNFKPGPMPHDAWAYFLALGLGRVILLPDVLALHRLHEQNFAGVTRGDVIQTAGATGATTYRSREDLAVVYSRWWRDLAVELPAHEAGATDAARAWDKVAARYQARAAVYEAGAGTWQRAANLVGATRCGAYLPGPHLGFGLRSAAKDLASFFRSVPTDDAPSASR